MADISYDVVIVGGGVSGCAIARELSRYETSVCVVEQQEDVCCGTSKANSAIVHAGFDAQTGSLMARLNVEGARLMPGLCEELGVDYQQIGSLVVCTSEETRPGLMELLSRGVANGVDELRIIDREELLALEPNVSDEAVAALWAPAAGIVNPFQLTVALAEVAVVNGVDFRFNEKVESLSREESGLWVIRTSVGELRSRCVVNAAGVFADELHNMAAGPDDRLAISPRRGQYYVLDTAAAGYVRHTVFALPTALGKGVLVTPTTAGNILVGPTAEDIDDKRGVDTTAGGVAEVRSKSSITMKDVPFQHAIRTFSGLRAHQPGHDFIIGEVAGAPGFVDCAAIESPGLSSAPAIGRTVADIVRSVLVYPAEKPFWQGTRKRIPDVEHLSLEEWTALVKERPDYGHIICRCRRVTEGQIVDAVRSPLKPRSLDAVKRRVEAGMGRCQGGFCSPKVMEIIAREAPDMAMGDVTKMGPGSELVFGHTRPQAGGEAR
ncbi:NAD(P)/FAD-dependent oxidoreductase [Paratractidigestivibacter sp.]|uniref:NAD(P)/FAD-dependent oxidoreductase n=1 Tax=Paratractidigestivibacter sp. TaxID=2847316 RepID=UPI002ABD22A9|nr:NAD(P)/FAD-dependent oxidoreductase [Paratractidigestivibacter sp.]